MALGWIDLAISAVTTGISIFQGFKAKKKQAEAIKRAQEEAVMQQLEAHRKQLEENKQKLLAILLEQKNADALEAQKQKIIKIISFAAAGFSAYILIKRLRKKNTKKAKK